MLSNYRIRWPGNSKLDDASLTLAYRLKTQIDSDEGSNMQDNERYESDSGSNFDCVPQSSVAAVGCTTSDTPNYKHGAVKTGQCDQGLPEERVA